MKRSLKATFAAIVVISLLAIVAGACQSTLAYWRFRTRSQSYYQEVATACDQLIAQYKQDAPFKAGGRRIPALPSVLRPLAPSFLVVDTNGVSLLMGGGFDGYHVI
jgi:type II secretory pathway pseudopilin PulG